MNGQKGNQISHTVHIIKGTVSLVDEWIDAMISDDVETIRCILGSVTEDECRRLLNGDVPECPDEPMSTWAHKPNQGPIKGR